MISALQPENIARRLRQYPLIGLTSTFILWKILLLLIASTAPGVGYDTSTNLLFAQNSSVVSTSQVPLSQKLTRWDAIYFVQKALRGDVFEQEWAFGKGVSSLLSSVSKDNFVSIAYSGIVISHITHYFAVVLLWLLAREVRPLDDNVCLTTAYLHVFSPAGTFLSAPYAESTFSCLSMLGYLIYARSRKTGASAQAVLRICAGAIFGLATVFRSNGILAGVIFLWDLLESLQSLTTNTNRRTWLSQFISIMGTIIGGLLIGCGFIIPQFIAYQEYCLVDSPTRPWCQSRLPLIYNFVQSYYWNVGFLRYWTPNNIPLFILATPSLALMLVSAISALSSNHDEFHNIGLARRLALPQLILTVLAITNYHVQIITRLAAAYPWVYIWVASQMKTGRYSKYLTRGFVMYAIIQAGLFSSFLPPA